MAIITLAQTNGLVAAYNAGSSGATAGDVTVGADMTDGGSLGSTEFLPDTVNSLDADRGCIRWLSTTAIGVTNWASGNYVVPINITTALADNLIEEVWIDELQSDLSTYNTVVSATALAISIATTGVKPDATGFVINRGSDFTADSTGSFLSITVVFTSQKDHGGTAFGVTPDQTITTPIDDGVSGAPIPVLMANYARRHHERSR